ARASCLVIHSGDARTSGAMSANAIISGAALPSIVGDYRVIIRWAFVRIPTRSQVFDWWSITGGAMAKLEIACAQDPTLDRRMPRQRTDARPAIPIAARALYVAHRDANGGLRVTRLHSQI